MLAEPGPIHARAVPPAAPPAPLTEDDFALLRRAVVCRRPVRNAARTARFSALTILVIGVAGIPLAVLSPSWLGTVMVAGICAIGAVEYVGARRMQRGLISAAGLLGTNQLVFMGLIVAYCVTQMLTFSAAATESSLLPADVRSQLSQLQGGDLELDRQLRVWAPLAAYGFYSLVILLSLCFQGGLAVYYFTRKRHLRAFEAATPAWVQRLFGELGV